MAEVVGSSAAQGLPSTHAGGQDDVSYNKLPQIIVPLCMHSVYMFPSIFRICSGEASPIMYIGAAPRGAIGMRDINIGTGLSR